MKRYKIVPPEPGRTITGFSKNCYRLYERRPARGYNLKLIIFFSLITFGFAGLYCGILYYLETREWWLVNSYSSHDEAYTVLLSLKAKNQAAMNQKIRYYE